MVESELDNSGVVVINGANGILGGTILRRPGNEKFLAGTRRDFAGLHRKLIIRSDGTFDAGALDGVKAIINCAGRVVGSADELNHSNVEHAVNLAKAAKAANVKTFVQVSSFSIFGKQELIEKNSPLKPVADYGRSKLLAEKELLQLGDASFRVICARLPFMFGSSNPSLMGKLIRILHRAPVFPITSQTVKRSMLTYEDAAALLVSLAKTKDVSEKINLADPEVFTVPKLIGLMQQKKIKVARSVVIPQFSAGLVKAVAPSIGDRLFAGSFLQDSCNWASGQKLPVGLTAGISLLLDDPKFLESIG
jgi:nucleoside-diphosphate-sugar epimerase